MFTAHSPIRFRIWLALIGLAAFVLAWLWSLAQPSAPVLAAAPQGGRDLQAYRQIVERVHNGEDYYDAAAEELREGGYCSGSVFNWRLPTYAWLLAVWPRPEWGQGLLSIVAVLALGLAYTVERKVSSVGRAILLSLLMAGAFLWCIDGDAFFSQELWAGVLIAVSIGAFAVNGKVLGVAAGLAALFMRELAAPYVLIAVILAIRERSWREIVAWGVGCAAFIVFFLWHAGQVQHHLTGQEIQETEGWLQFGGPAFVLRTCQMNVWLFKLPAWVALAYLAAAVVGLACSHGAVQTRAGLTVAVYLVAFLMVGKWVNNYWGLLYVAILPFGIVRLLSVRAFPVRQNETRLLTTDCIGLAESR
jgi:hypothetical protein